MTDQLDDSAALTDLDPASLPVADGDEPWTRAEVAEVVDELLGQRRHLTERLAVQEAELAGLLADGGDGAGADAADLGAANLERDQELHLVSSERETLAQIERSLRRLVGGDFGVCASCARPIPKMRVMAFPRATLCVSCKQREERR
ncbi:TraR/DksA family transcriptional regulator [Nocardioides zeae]|uniref:TraR/DksA family transcriptional regulator n=1 Tax=Nocardioides imazamoxiresistens TaxID=3231893 RepID=A0ABU3PU26_9ACTN|nr:TraR/DksA family transcriptional regulator [Nocardioides zeae]MDT9592727.1 TraR/DksA family transcriptional regulator [Nocardioides zeae]